MDIKKQIGLKVKDQRKKIKLTQKEFGVLVNFRTATISDIESGKVNVNIETLEQIAKALNIGLVIEFDLKVKK